MNLQPHPCRQRILVWAADRIRAAQEMKTSNGNKIFMHSATPMTIGVVFVMMGACKKSLLSFSTGTIGQKPGSVWSPYAVLCTVIMK